MWWVLLLTAAVSYGKDEVERCAVKRRVPVSIVLCRRTLTKGRMSYRIPWQHSRSWIEVLTPLSPYPHLGPIEEHYELLRDITKWSSIIQKLLTFTSSTTLYLLRASFFGLEVASLGTEPLMSLVHRWFIPIDMEQKYSHSHSHRDTSLDTPLGLDQSQIF